MKIRPLHDRVVIKRVEAEEKNRIRYRVAGRCGREA